MAFWEFAQNALPNILQKYHPSLHFRRNGMAFENSVWKIGYYENVKLTLASVKSEI